MSSIRDPPPMSEPYEGWKNEVHAWSIYIGGRENSENQARNCTISKFKGGEPSEFRFSRFLAC